MHGVLRLRSASAFTSLRMTMIEVAKVAGCRFQVSGLRLQFTDSNLSFPIFDRSFPIADCGLQIFDCRLDGRSLRYNLQSKT